MAKRPKSAAAGGAAAAAPADAEVGQGVSETTVDGLARAPAYGPLTKTIYQMAPKTPKFNVRTGLFGRQILHAAEGAADPVADVLAQYCKILKLTVDTDERGRLVFTSRVDGRRAVGTVQGPM